VTEAPFKATCTSKAGSSYKTDRGSDLGPMNSRAQTTVRP
jgi:hypothetical protein